MNSDVLESRLRYAAQFRVKSTSELAPLLMEAANEVARLEQERDEAAAARRRVPGAEGGPGKEEQYWMRAKLGAAITQLRDLEDFYRLRGGTPTSFNQVRADRARQLYEAITEDFLNGSMTRPTTRERADAAEADLAAARAREQRCTPALANLLARHVALVESGDCGHWNAEEEPEVIVARVALADQPAAGPSEDEAYRMLVESETYEEFETKVIESASAAADEPTRKCPNCNGLGKVRDRLRVDPVTCSRCDGVGRISTVSAAADEPGERE